MKLVFQLGAIALLSLSCCDRYDQKSDRSDSADQIDDQSVFNVNEERPEDSFESGLELRFLEGKWKSRVPEDKITLIFDYKVLTIESKGLWRDLNGVKVLVSEKDLNFIYNNDLFLISCFNLHSRIPVLTVFREVPMESENYEKIEFVR